MTSLPRALMVQGCSSNAGKTYLVAALCRIFARQGLRVAPFKAQNMSNNAGVTPDGLEMGRAQLLQAQAARIRPDVRMNPVLIKPEGDTRSQVLLLGKPAPDIAALPWTGRKARLWPQVQASLHSLASEVDMLLIEGAGSPAEINLRDSDIVNMAVAREVQAAVLLVCDIDRGGAFAHLLGTWHCLTPEERALLKGFVLNKFRGDPALLRGGIDWLEQQSQLPTLGVIPYLELALPEEDAFSLRPMAIHNLTDSNLPEAATTPVAKPPLVVAIVRYPLLSNFDEFQPLAYEPELQLRWVQHPQELQDAQLIILPGSKQVAADLQWLRACGLEAAIKQQAAAGTRILGICGGLQMLGRSLADPEHLEGGSQPGLALLDVHTEYLPDKVTRQRHAQCLSSGLAVSGYEIHHGRSVAGEAAHPWLSEDLGYSQGNVWGAYLHGLFESAAFRQQFLADLGVAVHSGDWSATVDAALEHLADHVEAHLDLSALAKAADKPASKAISKAASKAGRSPHVLISGGVRSGKSRYAESLAQRYGQQVCYVATLEPNDEEMQRRIQAHQQRRPGHWQTYEVHCDLLSTLQSLTADKADVVLLDCLSGWVSNLLLEHESQGEAAVQQAIMHEVQALCSLLPQLPYALIIVSNEVGCGVVPPYPLGRWYRDALGMANQRLAATADTVCLVSMGIPQLLKGQLD